MGGFDAMTDREIQAHADAWLASIDEDFKATILGRKQAVPSPRLAFLRLRQEMRQGFVMLLDRFDRLEAKLDKAFELQMEINRMAEEILERRRS